ncbi:MAG: flagellar basal-body rod protein FlgG [Pseudomonadota bacterium]
MRTLKIAATGMSAQQLRVEVIANNLANMSTTGFNARRAEFADLHYQQMERPGEINAADGTILPTGIQLGLGVRPTSVSAMLEQGALKNTGNDLDLAIEGRGYFEVALPSGEPAYTRDGGLRRNAEGTIVTADGFPVEPEIEIPEEATALAINPDGEVYAYFGDQIEAELLGRLTLASFVNPRGLEAMGNNLFTETEASGPATIGDPGEDGLGLINQGYLEESTVDAVNEVTELIEAQRGYELNAKVITAADEMMAVTAQVR